MKLEELKEGLTLEKKKAKELEGSIEAEKKARIDTEERRQMLTLLTDAEKLAQETSKELAQYKDKDPEIINRRSFFHFFFFAN